jgi:hypothetical protein
MVFSRPFWEVLIRPAVLPFFILALLDGAMTVFGTSKALGGDPILSLVAGLIVGVGVLITLLCTFDIWGTWHAVLRESPFLTVLLRSLWSVALLFDWTTSAWGLYELIGFGETAPELSAAWLVRFAIIAAAALVICGSTLVVSFMTYNERRETETGQSTR